MLSGFPVVCRLPAFRFSVIRFAPRGWAFLAVGLPAKTGRTAMGVTTFRTQGAATGVGASYTPRTAVLIPAGWAPQAAPAASQRRVPAPRSSIPPAESQRDEASTEVQVLHRSGLPLACSPRMERAPLGFA
jgi:hypothetical protein